MYNLQWISFNFIKRKTIIGQYIWNNCVHCYNWNNKNKIKINLTKHRLEIYYKKNSCFCNEGFVIFVEKFSLLTYELISEKLKIMTKLSNGIRNSKIMWSTESNSHFFTIFLCTTSNLYIFLNVEFFLAQ